MSRNSTSRWSVLSVRQALKAHPDRRVLKDSKGSPARQERRARRALKDQPARPAPLARRVPKEYKAILALPVRKELQAS
jgi:hypothetical protein